MMAFNSLNRFSFANECKQIRLILMTIFEGSDTTPFTFPLTFKMVHPKSVNASDLLVVWCSI